MVKSGGGGGTKRKIDKMEKISRREYLATTFTKRSSGLHSKAAQLCLLADAQIAILATPPSTHSNVSFFSFGHSSVDAVVNAYLTGQRLAPVREEPMEEDIGVCMARRELGLECWWEKESLSNSKDPRELMDAIKAMERMLSKLRSREFVSSDEDLKSNEMPKSDVVSQQGTRDVDETLNLQAVSCCVPGDDDDLPEGFDKKITEEQDQILAICGSFCAKEDNNNNINGLSGSLDEPIDLVTNRDSSAFDYGVLDSTQELHETTESLLMNFEAAAAHDVSTNPNPHISVVSEGVFEDGALVFQNKAANDVSTKNTYHIYDFEGVEEEAFVFQNRALDEDNLKLSD